MQSLCGNPLQPPRPRSDTGIARPGRLLARFRAGRRRGPNRLIIQDGASPCQLSAIGLFSDGGFSKVVGPPTPAARDDEGPPFAGGRLGASRRAGTAIRGSARCSQKTTVEMQKRWWMTQTGTGWHRTARFQLGCARSRLTPRRVSAGSGSAQQLGGVRTEPGGIRRRAHAPAIPPISAAPLTSATPTQQAQAQDGTPLIPQHSGQTKSRLPTDLLTRLTFSSRPSRLPAP